MQSLLQLYRLHVKCYFLNLREDLEVGLDRIGKWAITKENTLVKQTFNDAIVEEKPKSAFHNLSSRGIVVVPIDFDLKSLSEEDQKILLDLISAGRVIGVQDLYCLALIQ